VSLIALDILRSFAVLRFETRIGVAMQAALVDRVVSAPARFFREFASGDLALRMGSVNTVQRAITGSTIETFATSIFLLANLGLMLAYSPALTLAASGILILVVAVSATLGTLRLRIGPRIEALDGKLSAMTYEVFSGIAKLRAAAAEGRVFEQWYAKYDAYRDAKPCEHRAQQLRDRGALAAAARGDDPGPVARVEALRGQRHAPFHRRLRGLPRGAVRVAGRRACAGLDDARSGEPEARLGSRAPDPGDAPGGCRRAWQAPRARGRHHPLGAQLQLSGGEPVLSGIDLDIRPGSSSRSSARAARASRRCCGCCWVSNHPARAA
jgi:hypothetical protein